MGDVKLFRLSGSAAVIDLRTGNNATLRPGLVVLSEDAHTHAIAALEAENAKLRAELERQAVDGWKLVPVDPTPEMIRAAEEAHMPFGDMDIALRMAILSAAPAKATDGLRIGAWRDALEKIAKYAPAVNCAARTEIERIGLIAVHALIAFSAPQFSQTPAHQEAINGAAPSTPATVQGVNQQLLEALEFAVREQSGDVPTKEPSAWLLNARKVLAEAAGND